MLHSDYRSLGAVSLPAWQGRQLYMFGFDASNPTLPGEFSDFQQTVVELCQSSGAIRRAWLTVDEKIVSPGMSQRRPRPHLDGDWIEELSCHGSGHQHPVPSHVLPGRHGGHSTSLSQSLIVAASVAGCRAWRGEFDGVPGEGGDLSHIQHTLGEGEVLPANTAYLLSPECIHESMVFPEKTQRTFVRIATYLN